MTDKQDAARHRNIMRAINPLKRALQKACDAGVTHEMLCVNAGAAWGGFFSWNYTPAPVLTPEAKERIDALEQLLKESEAVANERLRMLLKLGAEALEKEEPND